MPEDEDTVLRHREFGDRIRLMVPDMPAQNPADPAVRHADGIVFDLIEPRRAPLREIGVALTPIGAPVEGIGRPRGMPFGIDGRYFRPVVTLPVAEMDFLQAIIGPVTGTLEARVLANDLHCLGRPLQRTCHEVEGAEIEA